MFQSASAIRALQSVVHDKIVLGCSVAAGKTMDKRLLPYIDILTVWTNVDIVMVGAGAMRTVTNPIHQVCLLEQLPASQSANPGRGIGPGIGQALGQGIGVRMPDTPVAIWPQLEILTGMKKGQQAKILTVEYLIHWQPGQTNQNVSGPSSRLPETGNDLIEQKAGGTLNPVGRKDGQQAGLPILTQCAQQLMHSIGLLIVMQQAEIGRPLGSLEGLIALKDLVLNISVQVDSRSVGSENCGSFRMQSELQEEEKDAKMSWHWA
jgi:hypothetical protein